MENILIKFKYLYIYFNIILEKNRAHQNQNFMDSLLWRRRLRKIQVRPFKADFEDPRYVEGRRQERMTLDTNLGLTVQNQRMLDGPNEGRVRQFSGLRMYI